MYNYSKNHVGGNVEQDIHEETIQRSHKKQVEMSFGLDVPVSSIIAFVNKRSGGRDGNTVYKKLCKILYTNNVRCNL